MPDPAPPAGPGGNAADKIFGIALDKSGQTLGVHGVQTAFAAVAQPFHIASSPARV